MWGLVSRFIELKNGQSTVITSLSDSEFQKLERNLEEILNKTIEDVSTLSISVYFCCGVYLVCILLVRSLHVPAFAIKRQMNKS